MLWQQLPIEAGKSLFSVLDKLAKKGSTVEDVDALLTLTHEFVNYA